MEHLWPLLRDARVLLMSTQGGTHRPHLGHSEWGASTWQGRAEGTLALCYPPPKATSHPHHPLLSGRVIGPVRPGSRALGDGRPRRGWARFRAGSQGFSRRVALGSSRENCPASTWRPRDTSLLVEEAECRHTGNVSVGKNSHDQE